MTIPFNATVRHQGGGDYAIMVAGRAISVRLQNADGSPVDGSQGECVDAKAWQTPRGSTELELRVLNTQHDVVQSYRYVLDYVGLTHDEAQALKAVGVQTPDPVPVFDSMEAADTWLEGHG